MHKIGRAGEQGFTVVELIVAIIVGTLFVITANGAVTNYVDLSQRNKTLTLANSFVEGQVEGLRNVGYNSLTPGTTDISSQLPSELPSPKSASITVGSPVNGIKQIDINITYNGQTAQSYDYTTYIGELGVGQ